MEDRSSKAESDRLSELLAALRAVTGRISPFPAFPGAMFAYGLEVPPPDGMETDAGCVILGNDGALYELRIGIDADQVALGADHVGARHEELVPLELPAAELTAFAERALEVAEDYLREREAREA